MKKSSIIAVASLLLFSFLETGCADINRQNSEKNVDPPDALTWIVYTDEFALEDSLSQYRTIAQAFQGTQIRVEVSFSPYNSSVEVSRMLASDALPDLMTFELSDRNAAKLSKNKKVLPVREISEALYAAVPEELLNTYADNDGVLYGLPGGFGGDIAVPLEGLFVNEAYYNALKKPDMHTVAGFCEALKAFSSYASSEGNRVNIPLVFGKNLNGLSTMEHIFGVYPVYREGARYIHRIFSPSVTSVTNFLAALANKNLGTSLTNLDENNFDYLMQSQVFACFARTADIARYNRQNPGERFITVEPPFATDGFLEGQAASGGFKTMVSASTPHKEEAGRLLQYLYTEDLSLELMYGRQDEYWYEENGRQIPIENKKKELLEDPAVAQKSGIALFPFLSRHGSYSPYTTQTDSRAEDIRRWKYTVNPTDYLAGYLRGLDSSLSALYSECLNGERTSLSVQKEIDHLRRTNLRAVNAVMVR